MSDENGSVEQVASNGVSSIEHWYQTCALTTEAPVNPDCELRIISQAMAIGNVLNELSAIGSVADRVKKYVFYGRQLERTEYQNVFKLDIESRLLNFDSFIMNKENRSGNARLFHALLGILTEAAEIANAMIAAIETGNEMDVVNLVEEIGDVQWYVAVGADAIGQDLSDIMEANVEKLGRKRYKSGGFTAAEADVANRDTEHEVSHIKAVMKYRCAEFIDLEPPKKAEQGSAFSATCNCPKCMRKIDISSQTLFSSLLAGNTVVFQCPHCKAGLKSVIDPGGINVSCT